MTTGKSLTGTMGREDRDTGDRKYWKNGGGKQWDNGEGKQRDEGGRKNWEIVGGKHRENGDRMHWKNGGSTGTMGKRCIRITDEGQGQRSTGKECKGKFDEGTTGTTEEGNIGKR